MKKLLIKNFHNFYRILQFTPFPFLFYLGKHYLRVNSFEVGNWFFHIFPLKLEENFVDNFPVFQRSKLLCEKALIYSAWSWFSLWHFNPSILVIPAAIGSNHRISKRNLFNLWECEKFGEILDSSIHCTKFSIQFIYIYKVVISVCPIITNKPRTDLSKILIGEPRE